MANRRRRRTRKPRSKAPRSRSIEWDLFSKRIFIRARSDLTANQTPYTWPQPTRRQSDPTPLTRRAHHTAASRAGSRQRPRSRRHADPPRHPSSEPGQCAMAIPVGASILSVTGSGIQILAGLKYSLLLTKAEWLSYSYVTHKQVITTGRYQAQTMATLSKM